MTVSKKFKVWDTLEKKLYPFCGVGLFPESGKFSSVSIYNNGIAVKFENPGHRFILLQSTGVFDIKGQEIFESDIVDRLCQDDHCNTKHSGMVGYDENYAGYSIIEREGGQAFPLVATNELNLRYPITKVGNAFETGEAVTESELKK